MIPENPIANEIALEHYQALAAANEKLQMIAVTVFVLNVVIIALSWLRLRHMKRLANEAAYRAEWDANERDMQRVERLAGI